MTFAAPARCLMSKSNIHHLQIVQNKALRLIGQYDRYTRNEQLRSNNEIYILKRYVKIKLEIKTYASTKVSRNQYIQKLGSDYNLPRRLSSWVSANHR